MFCIFTDIAYTAYFNSFYSEPTAFVALLIIAGSSLLLMSRHRAGWILLAAYFVAAAVLTEAEKRTF